MWATIGALAALFLETLKQWAGLSERKRADEVKDEAQLHEAVKGLPADELPRGYERQVK